MGAVISSGKVPQFKKAEALHLKEDSRFNEKWLEQLVCDDPEILGLGKLKVLFRQKHHRDGIVDVVLGAEDKSSVYVVELMLGPLDESHIVRTLSYWLQEKDAKDLEYKDADYRAVLIGERILDSRFLNVVKFLTAKMPELVVMEVAALEVGNSMTLHFTTILRSGELELTANHEPPVPVSHESWLEKSKATVEVAEAVIKLLRETDPSISPNFRQGFIGIFVGNRPVLNLVSFGPFGSKVKFRIRVEDPAQWRRKLAKAGLQVLQADRTDENKVRIAVTREDISRHGHVLRELCKDGYCFWAK